MKDKIIKDTRRKVMLEIVEIFDKHKMSPLDCISTQSTLLDIMIRQLKEVAIIKQLKELAIIKKKNGRKK